VELDIPTIPAFGRRPDFAYYSTADAARIDLDANLVLGVPTLVVEVLSEDDEERDTVTKRTEYALAGIQHYWILDPQQRTALTLALRGSAYEVAAEFCEEDVLTSALFPGIEIPLKRLFR
jgi:Uma2 family endonuclease